MRKYIIPLVVIIVLSLIISSGITATYTKRQHIIDNCVKTELMYRDSVDGWQYIYDCTALQTKEM